MPRKTIKSLEAEIQAGEEKIARMEQLLRDKNDEVSTKNRMINDLKVETENHLMVNKGLAWTNGKNINLARNISRGINLFILIAKPEGMFLRLLQHIDSELNEIVPKPESISNILESK